LIQVIELPGTGAVWKGVICTIPFAIQVTSLLVLVIPPMLIESDAKWMANKKFIKSYFKRSVAVFSRPFATVAVTTVSVLQLLICSRGNPISELLLKFSESNNIWYWTGSFQVFITIPPTGYVWTPGSSAVS
jgi:ACR3 family arsenite efflux pump ArsB